MHKGVPACAGGQGGGVEDITPEVLHGQPQTGLQPPRQRKEVPMCGDLLLLKRPQKIFEQRLGGGVEVGCFGQYFDMLFVGAPLRALGTLGGGGDHGGGG